MKKIIILLFAVVSILDASAQERKVSGTVNNDEQMKKFIDDLMGKMTTEEKLGSSTWYPLALMLPVRSSARMLKRKLLKEMLGVYSIHSHPLP